jgi:signal transduction histidine kinase
VAVGVPRSLGARLTCPTCPYPGEGERRDVTRQALKDLIAQAVDTPAKLELALYFERNPNAVEEIQGLARRVGRDAVQVDTAVRELVAAGCLSAEAGTECLGPGTLFSRRTDDPRCELWAELAQAYEEEPSAVHAAVREADRLSALRRLSQSRRLHDLQVRFMAMVSHELRTPASTILAAVQSLISSKQALSPGVEEGLRVIERAARHMARNVDDLLLSLASSVGEAPELRLTELDLGALVGQVVEAAARQYPKHVWEFALPEEPLPLVGDAERLQAVVDGLVRNSARFSSPGTRVEVTLGAEDDQVWLAVDDEGPGLSPADHFQVFECFYQAQTDATRLPGGLGLGLYLARVTVEAHGGHIAIERKSGPGLRTVLRLPRGGPTDSASTN